MFYNRFMIYITLILKACNKMRRATDIISHSLSERRSIFNASRWSKPSNVTGCFTTYTGVHSPAAEVDNTVWLRLRPSLGGVRDLWCSSKLFHHFGHLFLLNTSGMLEC